MQIIGTINLHILKKSCTFVLGNVNGILLYSILLAMITNENDYRMTLSEHEIEMRAQHAYDLFRHGFNCSQAVFASCADLYGIDEKTALRLSASFGGGIGRMRLVCGAASGMFLLAGLENGSCTQFDNKGKMENYELVQDLAGQFQNKYGSLICAELLGLAPKGTVSGEWLKLNAKDPTPEARTPEYYEKRPCPEMIAQTVRIFLIHRNERIKQ